MRVAVTAPLAIDVRPLLGAGAEVRAADRPLRREELLDFVADAEALICLLTDRIDEELVARAPRLRIVANHAVGIDNIDLAATGRRGILVTNTPDCLTEATADLTFALMLATARHLVEGDALVRSGAWRGWEPTLLMGAEVHARTLGIVGLGRIGRAVARRARGFDMRVVYTHPRPADMPGYVPLEALLSEADFVSLHCPLTEATRGIIGGAQLARMKSSAILVNTARGACIDEDALAGALEQGKLAGAGLDVFTDEPHVSKRLLAAPRVVLAPHIGSATVAARTRMAELCAQAVRAVMDGVRPANLVVAT